MLVKSLKFKEFACFKSRWSGLDDFKPITVIVGRNNSGKSRLIDFFHIFNDGGPTLPNVPKQYSALLDEPFLEKVFSKTKTGEGMGPQYRGLYEPESHWNRYGEPNLGRCLTWETIDGKAVVDSNFRLNCGRHDSHQESFHLKAIDAIQRRLSSEQLVTPFGGRIFRRINADRNLVPETATVDLKLLEDGTGATNVIRRFLTSSNLDSSVIQKRVLDALNAIFRDQGRFDGIEIRQHEQGKPGFPTEVWEVFLREPNKGLISLSDSGSGLKTVLLMLLNLIVMPISLQKSEGLFIFAFEELENNLHPALLRRLFRFIAEYVDRHDCMVFLTSHSNIALDFFSSQKNAQIISVEHDGLTASTKTLAIHFDHVSLLSQLGARASDLLHANGVVWLEGPSDRIYFNRFIEIFSDGQLVEGRDYQCAYYGGSVLAHIKFTPPESTDTSLNNLLRINHNIAVICDGDRRTDIGPGSRLKERVRRVVGEVDKIPNAYLWVTDAKEIENYIPGEIWSKVYNKPKVPSPGKYDSFPSTGLTEDDFVSVHLGRKSFDKCDFAAKAAPHLTKENLATRFELEKKMTELVETIRSWSAN